MLEQQGRVLKLCDIGVSRRCMKRSAADELLLTVIGNELYKAPEAFGPTYGLPADVWSVGAVLYHLMMLHPPYEPPTAARMLEWIKTKERRPPPDRCAATSRQRSHLSTAQPPLNSAAASR